MVGQNRVAHTLNDRGTGRRLVDLMEKMDRGATGRPRPRPWFRSPIRSCSIS